MTANPPISANEPMVGSNAPLNSLADGSVPARHDAPINILIVDDELKNLIVLETILDDPAYRFVRAETADQALLALVAEEFALIIFGYPMPGMTGFELAQPHQGSKENRSCTYYLFNCLLQRRPA